MVKLNLYLGRQYDGYGEQLAARETICLTNKEAAYWLTKLIEEKGGEYIKTWLSFAKDIKTDLGRTHTDTE